MDRVFSNIVFMKYGVHASESIESIISRKMEEISVCKSMFWGYGGVVCHPINQIQPFLEENFSRAQKTFLVMSKTPSRLNNTPSAAMHYSHDKLNWKEIPRGIHVLGSKYAIVCSSIVKCDFDIDLTKYVIPIGNSKGRLLSQYVQGRVDKACGRYIEKNDDASYPIHISLCAEIVYPYAVFLK